MQATAAALTTRWNLLAGTVAGDFQIQRQILQKPAKMVFKSGAPSTGPARQHPGTPTGMRLTLDGAAETVA